MRCVKNVKVNPTLDAIAAREVNMRLSPLILIASLACGKNHGPLATKITTTPVCLSGNCADGFGTQQADSVQTYIGSFKNGLYHGNGILRCGSEAIIKAEFREGVIDGSFELDMKTLVITGKIASGKYEDKLVMVAKEAATKYRIEKTYDKGMLNGQTTIFLDSGKAQFIFQFKLNSLISAGYYENDILKMPLRYQRKPEAGVRKCQISAVEDGRPISLEIACIENPEPELFLGCNGI